GDLRGGWAHVPGAEDHDGGVRRPRLAARGVDSTQRERGSHASPLTGRPQRVPLGDRAPPRRFLSDLYGSNWRMVPESTRWRGDSREPVAMRVLVAGRRGV